MDKQIITAVYYLFFAGQEEDFHKLKRIKSETTNSNLLKILEVCFLTCKLILEEKKEAFFENALNQTEPLFFGYGFISENELDELTKKFIEQFSQDKPELVTRTILSLRNIQSTNTLALNTELGLSSKKSEIISIWIELCPSYNSHFLESVQNPENYALWHSNTTSHLGFLLLDYKTLQNSQNTNHYLWQDFFEENLHTNISTSIQILFFQMMSLESESRSLSAENKVLINIKKCLEFVSSSESFIDNIYALSIATNASPYFIKEIYNLIPFSCTSWAFIAIALTAPKLDIQTLNYAILNELQSIREALLNDNLDKDEYILEVITRFQSIIIGAEQYHIQVTQQTLSALKDISILIQNIIDSFDDNADNSDSENAADWNGQLIKDKPIARWNAILQVCLNKFLSTHEISFYEKILTESFRVAPHVEKRWIVRALVCLDSDEAIKSILYQALHHIDTDFVERTVYELFNSHHPRAKQALVRLIAKNSLSDRTKIAIVENIKHFASEEIGNELKDLMVLRLPENVEKVVRNALQEISEKNSPKNKHESFKNTFSSSEIDLIIKSFIHNVSLLSVDSRSALRTAEMIYIQSKDWGKEAVDLSPIVNMFCKSLELTLRDTFEPYTDAIMRKGELSKKLDFLGYGKMTQDKMQNFEDFIADLPIINTIPYFSKFKLRKMLRAICLYRPGKRFTLDGPKAFALFLLVTARKECPHALDNIFNLPFLNEEELFTFVKDIHSLQDNRNRAVHEGLTWEAREEIDNMRKQAYSIINIGLKIGSRLTLGHAPEAICS